MLEKITNANLIRIDQLIQEIYFNVNKQFEMLPTKISMSEENLLKLADETGLVSAELLINLYEAYVKAKNISSFTFQGLTLFARAIEDRDDKDDPKPLHIIIKIEEINDKLNN